MPGKSVCTLSALADPTIGWQATLSTPNAPPRPVKCAERLDVNFSPVCVCGGGYPYPLPPIISIIIVTIITIIIITIIIKIFCELFTGVCVGPISTFSSHVLVCMFLIVYQHISVFVFWKIVFAFAFLGFHQQLWSPVSVHFL